MQTILIIGGVAAGLAAAMQARRTSPDADIVVFERGPDISYGACGIPYHIGGVIPRLDDLVLHGPDYFWKDHQIKVLLNSEAFEILPGRSIVRVRSNGSVSEHTYTSLVIATGAIADCPELPGHDLEGVFVIRHLSDAVRMHRFLSARQIRNAVVVGAGYIGLEMAEAFSRRGFHTTLLQSDDKVMTSISGTIRDRVANELSRNNVEILFNEPATEFAGEGNSVIDVLTASGRKINADVVALGMGVKPNVDLAKNSGVEVGNTGAIRVDQFMRTSEANIFAAGDCCEVLHRISGMRVWFPLGQPAIRQGWVAGENAAGSGTSAKYGGIVGTLAVKVFDLEVARTGLSLEDAREVGFDAFATEVRSFSRAGYYPGGSEILSTIIHNGRGRLLGAELAGCEGVAQRINVYAAALHSGMSLDEIGEVDFAYAPPVAPTIDPILRAVHVAGRQSKR